MATLQDIQKLFERREDKIDKKFEKLQSSIDSFYGDEETENRTLKAEKRGKEHSTLWVN